MEMVFNGYSLTGFSIAIYNNIVNWITVKCWLKAFIEMVIHNFG